MSLQWWNDGKVWILAYVALVTYALDDENQMKGWWTSAISKETVVSMAKSVGFWTTIGILSLEHVCYSYLWKKPEKFRKISTDICGDKHGHKGIVEKVATCGSPRNSSNLVFEKIRSYGEAPWKFVHVVLIVNKILQLVTFLGWYVSVVRQSKIQSSGGRLEPCSFWGFQCWTYETVMIPLFDMIPTVLAKATLYQWSLAIPMIILGQILNFSVYRAIGKVGVYYGYKLGVHVPWQTGWPFNAFRHPQYVGAVLSWFAIVSLLACVPGIVEAGLFGIATGVLVSYVAMSLVETDVL